MVGASHTAAADLAGAVEKLNAAGDGIVRWAASVRPRDGSRGRFRWSLETTRDANIGATFYVLCGLDLAGLLDRVITAEDRAAGMAWLERMAEPGGQFIDPALWSRRSPDWPPHEPWPSGAMQATVNQYAQGCRGLYRGERVDDLGASEPPADWPQVGDDPAATVAWIRRRPFDQNAWGAGSHATRMICFMLRWQREGRFPLESIAEALRYLFAIQDAQTGLWGTPAQAHNVRINGAFKLFVSLVDQLDLPVPHGRRLIDEVLTELTREGYEQQAGGCDEFDNWYVLSLLHAQHPAYRTAEIRAQAVRSLHRIIDNYACADGGFSYSPGGRCAVAWNGFDMCEAVLSQGDALGFAVLARAIDLCVDVLDLHAASPWTGRSRMREGFSDAETKGRLQDLVFGPSASQSA